MMLLTGDPRERHALRARAGQPARQRVQPHRAAHARAPPQRAGRGARQVRAAFVFTANKLTRHCKAKSQHLNYCTKFYRHCILVTALNSNIHVSWSRHQIVTGLHPDCETKMLSFLQKTGRLLGVHNPGEQHAINGYLGLVGGRQPVHHAVAAAALRS